MRYFLALLLITALGGKASADGHTPEFAVNVYGFSYHLDRTDINGRSFNEINAGIGFRATLKDNKKAVTFVEAGYFDDSFGHGARYASIGYQLKITPGILIGMNVGLYDTPSVRGAIVAPVPTLTFRYQFLAVNFVHMPGFSGLNPYPSFGGYLTFFVLKG